MKLKNLEMRLQNVKGFPAPRPELEQYITPAPLAARFLFDAFMHNDIEGLSVADLGCGTGMLSIGAALLGAEVAGIDTSAAALAVGEKNAAAAGVSIAFQQGTISPATVAADSFDTVVMNPPFGAQVEHADRPFIEAALSAAPVVWGIFNKGSIPFIKAYTKEKAAVTDMVSAQLSIPRQFAFHTKDVLEIPVEILRLERL
ncbi:MAG: METTL5 family protein [Methanocorpusculum sp.]|nr:METTL5 family protein [Methanocorpusculum sp.]